MKKKQSKSDARELRAGRVPAIPAPRLPYQPRTPRRYRPRIGLIGCGGITPTHLRAYRKMGFVVAALCDPRLAAARERQAEFYPEAYVCTDHRDLLARGDIDVVDIATHPLVRPPLVRDALCAGKHVLSQKPFVLDLAEGEQLVALARKKRRLLAVNQNGRWSPYVSYAREAVKAGLLGDVVSVDMTLAWDHSWIRGTPFERLRNVMLFDFGIHWFDIAACLFGARRPLSAFAYLTNVRGQTVAPPMSAHAALKFDGGLAAMSFHGHTRQANSEQLTVTGTEGIFRASGAVCAAHDVYLRTKRGECRPKLKGEWFPDGFAGAMGELLCAIEEGREPENSAASNLRSLALCFAALESTRTGAPVTPGKARAAGPGCVTK